MNDNNYYRLRNEPIHQPLATYKSCPDCVRLKALLGDVWDNVPGPMQVFSDNFISIKKYDELEARIKQEWI